MILVTDDRKDDWWLKIDGKTIGPRPELLQEIYMRAGVTFYMYSADPFMKYAGKYLRHKVEKKAIDEVREVRKEDEIRRHNREDILKRLRLALFEGSAGTSGSSFTEFIKKDEQGENARRALMEAAGFSIDEILRRESLRRALIGSAGSSGSATDEIFRQVKEKEDLMRILTGTAGSLGSATDEIFRQAKVAEKPAEIDISDMEKKDK